ncbi:MAG TPA: 6-carboxytetrahydropterin synthase QueD [Smithellaceae bacterium]|nr:6-carboxytetrahydropterin synthase QueD [Smithellaceae bacterium]
MYEVTIIKSFSAAHILSQVGGKCEELHGHNFKVELSVGAASLNQSGLLIDFRLVKKWLEEVLEEMDHKHLNEISGFAGINPSAENVARHIAEKIMPKAEKEGVKVTKVKVWESENACVTYTGD